MLEKSRMSNTWQESAKVHTAKAKARIVGMINAANHSFIDGAHWVSVDTIKDRIEQE